MQKLVVMDYSKGNIEVYDVNDSFDNDIAECALEHLGYNMDECYFMLCNNLNINFKEGEEIYDTFY